MRNCMKCNAGTRIQEALEFQRSFSHRPCGAAVGRSGAKLLSWLDKHSIVCTIWGARVLVARPDPEKRSIKVAKNAQVVLKSLSCNLQ